MTIESNGGFEELRREIAAAFDFDYANLTALQSTKIDLIASLRLSLDDLQMRLVAGDDTVDHGKLLSLSEILTKLLPQLADDDTRLKPQRLDARERLLALIEGAKVAAEANKKDEIAELKEKIDSLEATIRTLREAAARSTAVSPDPPPQHHHHHRLRRRPGNRRAVRAGIMRKAAVRILEILSPRAA
jgi:hypothetical protein